MPNSHQFDIFQLTSADEERFLAHLSELCASARRDRFNGVVGSCFLERYARDTLARGATVIALGEGDHIIAAAELHAVDSCTAEAAFSVSEGHRGKGLGAILFRQLLLKARQRKFTRIRITTHADNEAMKSLAAKFGVKMRFSDGEGWGEIELDQQPHDLLAA